MSRPSKIAIVKELGSRSPRCLAAHAVRGQDEPELVVVERYPAALGEGALAVLEDEAKELVPFEHTNVATIIASVKLKGDVAILSEWVDGESLASILSGEQKPSFEVLLRALVDACEGVTALHAHGGRVCGALGVDDVFVGVDGVTRITRFGLGKIAPSALGAKRLATMAPEFLRGEKSPRVDVFTLGTLAWECFMGKALFETPASVDAQLAKLAENPPRVDASKRDAWAAPLADVIARAVSIDPSARYATPSELSAAIAAAAPGKIATRAMVSQWVARVFGERIEARLVKLEPKVDVTFGSVAAPPMSIPPIATPAAAKVPVIDAAPVAAPAPIVAAPKEAPKAPEKLAETPKAKIVAPLEKKAEPAKETAKEKDSVKMPVAAAAGGAKKPAADIVKKAVPLPMKRVEPDSSPSLPAAAKEKEKEREKEKEKPVAAKTNGTIAAKDKPVAAKPAAATAPAALVVAKVRDKVPSVPIAIEEDEPAPPSSDVDSDIDIVSVHPPPIVAKKEEPPPAVASPAPIVPPAPPSPPNAVVAPAESEPEIPRPPPAPRRVSMRDSEINVYAKRSPYRGPLLVFVGLALAGGGFAVGRLTAPDAWPPTPAFSASTSAPTTSQSSHVEAPPPNFAPTSLGLPTNASSATNAASSATNAATSASAAHDGARVAPAPQAASDASTGRDGGPRYDPNGI